jgi:RNA-binding protein
MKLTPAERSALRAEAHGLNPVVMIGADGLTPSVLKEIDKSLDAHGLIKVRVFGDDREARVAMYEQICGDLGAAPVQHIGKLLVLYRPKKEKEEERQQKVRQGHAPGHHRQTQFQRHQEADRHQGHAQG